MLSTPDGSAITNTISNEKVSTGINIGTGRDAYLKTVTLNGETVKFYASYYDDGEWVGTGNKDPNSYASITPVGTTYAANSHLVFDIDLMLDDRYFERHNISHPLFFLVGHTDLAHKGNANYRKDSNAMTIDKEGWLVANDQKTKLYKLSANEFTRISLVIHTPELAEDNATIKKVMMTDVYVNGVLLTTISGNADQGVFHELRYLQLHNADMAFFVKDVYMYQGEKPQQFVTMKNGVPTQTTNLEDTPAKAADIKNGFVQENGIVRYYNELGLPVISGTISGTTVITDKFGKVPCDGSNHVAVKNGLCMVCGTKIDGVTSLYGHNLVLGDDVKVNFYLDIDTAKAEGAKLEIGTASRKLLLELSELETKVIDEKTYYIATFPVPAKDIGANITAKLVKEGETFTEYSYSAQTYIDAVKVAEVGGKITQELKDLVTALDEYGKNAAAVLAGGQQMVAIDDSEVDWNTVAEASGTKAAGSVVRLNTFSLDLKSKIRLRVYFEITSGSLSDYTVTVDESEVNAIAVEGNIYCIDYAVYAKELNTTVDIEIAKGEETMLTLSMAPLYYAKIMAAKYTGDNVDAYKNLMKAIKLYSDAASNM